MIKIDKITANLHDTVGANISTAKMYYAPLKKYIEDAPDEDKESFIKANELLDDSCNSIRKITKQLKEVQNILELKGKQS